MTSPHDQPLSRRAARRAEQTDQVDQGLADSFVQPPSTGVVRSDQSGGALSSVPSSAPTDMVYRTQVRPRVPHYDDRSESLTPTVSPIVTHYDALPPVAPAAGPTQDVERVRRRDFRPPAEPGGEAAPAGSTTFDAPLDYHTQLSAQAEVAVQPQPPAQLPMEQTLSRRELRELRAAPEGQTPESLVGSRSTTEELLAAYPAPQTTSPFATGTLVEPAPTPLAPPATPYGEPAREEPTRSEPRSPATGSHWSVGMHDDEDPFANTFSREVGSTTGSSTNALVLPEMPTGSIAGPVAGTGEIIVTGMIEVSHLVSSTGTVPTLHDSPDFDDLFDANDREVAAPDSAPVSALKAISSHTAAHTVMTGKRSRSNTVTTVLVASTVVMAVVAIGLFVIAAANGLF